METKQFDHASAAIEAAIINGQTQPWMYEVLAMTMEYEKRPAEEIERVVMSFTDFGVADFDSMTYAAAMLTSFQRDEAALRMYRQASTLGVERPEPYVLGLKLATKLKSPDDVQWAACGILEQDWTSDFQTHHRLALNAVAETERHLRQTKQLAAADKLHQAVTVAQVQDVVVRVEWSGTGDIDLSVEEPLGEVCSCVNAVTNGGGFHTHDGFGPRADHSYEEYVCPRAVTGEYTLRLKLTFEKLVADRALVTITTHKGTADEAVRKETVNFRNGPPVVKFRVAGGRRQDQRDVAVFKRPAGKAALAAPGVVRKGGRKAPPKDFGEELVQFMERATNKKSVTLVNGQIPGGGGAGGAGGGGVQVVGGVVAQQPIIQVIPEGSSLTVLPIVSADRRYVRLSLSPVFSTITDVFTFTFQR